MAVEYGQYEDGPELVDGGLVAESGDAWLISDADGAGEQIRLSEVDSEPGRVRIHTHDPAEDRIEYTDMVFEQLQMARLAFGLWEQCGPFTQPEGSAVPLEIATDGQEAIAAYLRVGNGYPKDRGYVADKMDVTEQTVSNYCNRVRWTP
jgi:hypothetical protein